MEKMLTYEEIVRALEDMASECETNFSASVVDLIHRQKAEIERLTEEHERIAWSKQQYLDWVHGFLSTHTDMKDRGEDYKMFDRDWMCGVFWAKIEGSIEYIIDLENQRRELQKQVDECYRDCEEYAIENGELIQQVDWLKEEMHKITCAENETYMIGFEDGEKKAIKDTAKEILTDIKFLVEERNGADIEDLSVDGTILEEILAEIAKKKGVEVE